MHGGGVLFEVGVLQRRGGGNPAGGVEMEERREEIKPRGGEDDVAKKSHREELAQLASAEGGGGGLGCGRGAANGYCLNCICLTNGISGYSGHISAVGVPRVLKIWNFELVSLKEVPFN
jgi:hypothetical protein